MRRTWVVVAAVLAALVAGGLAGPAQAAVRTWKSVAVGGNVSCAIDRSDHLWCWGYNGNGGVGNGDASGAAVTRPQQIGTATWRSVSPALYTTCGIRTSGQAYCWGQNDAGQVGNGSASRNDVLRPAAVSGGLLWKNVSSGLTDTCGVTTTGALACWGSRLYGGVGDGRTGGNPQLTPLRVGTGAWSTVHLGALHACGLSSAKQVKCWGGNPYGQLGTGSTTDSSVPVTAGGSGNTWKSVAADEYTTCAITAGGVSKCWGYNREGEVGDGTTTNALVPTALRVGSTSFTRINNGTDTSCGVTAAGKVRCWGANGDHQFGDGTTTDSLDPTDAAGAKTGFGVVSVGDQHSCGLRSDGRILCWGINSSGELGVGTTTAYAGPVVVGSTPAA